MSLYIVSGCFHTNTQRSVERFICGSAAGGESRNFPPTEVLKRRGNTQEKKRGGKNQFHREATPQTHTPKHKRGASRLGWNPERASPCPPCVIARQLKRIHFHFNLNAVFFVQYTRTRVCTWFQLQLFWPPPRQGLRGGKVTKIDIFTPVVQCL